MFQLDNPIFGSMSPSGGGSSDTDMLQQLVDANGDAEYLFTNLEVVDYSFTSNLDLSKCKVLDRLFYSNYNVTTIPEYDVSAVCSGSNYGLFYIFYNCSKLANFGGFKNLGKGFLTDEDANSSRCKLDLSGCTQLTEQSIINVLTKLYDINAKGCNTQSVVLGNTNMNKLTSSEGQTALESAINKGWTVS